MDWCEQNDVPTSLAWRPTRFWPNRCSPNSMNAASGARSPNGEGARLHRTRYAAKSWSRRPPRRGADRGDAERRRCPLHRHQHQSGTARGSMKRSIAPGQAENLIKRHKSQLASDRTSCRSPLANQMRLILHTAAYWLMRRCATPSHSRNRWPAANSPPSGCDC
jgi:hypothetical protein